MFLYMTKAVFTKRRDSWRSHFFVCPSVCDIEPTPQTLDKVSFSFRMKDFHEMFENFHEMFANFIKYFIIFMKFNENFHEIFENFHEIFENFYEMFEKIPIFCHVEPQRNL